MICVSPLFRNSVPGFPEIREISRGKFPKFPGNFPGGSGPRFSPSQQAPRPCRNRKFPKFPGISRGKFPGIPRFSRGVPRENVGILGSPDFAFGDTFHSPHFAAQFSRLSPFHTNSLQESSNNSILPGLFSSKRVPALPSRRAGPGLGPFSSQKPPIKSEKGSPLCN